MENEILEISCRQLGSSNRIQIHVNESSVTISGRGGSRRPEFVREIETPRALWNELGTQVGQLDLNELEAHPKAEKDAAWGPFLVRIQIGDTGVQLGPFSSLDPPDQLQPLFRTIFVLQSPLEEITYSENGMSEYLRLHIRREQTKIDADDDVFPGTKQTVAVTPADFWESLCLAVNEIDVNTLPEMAAPSNKRAADMSLYAALKIKCDGEWYKSKDFDDDNPPKPFRELVKLMNTARTGSFQYRQ